MAKAKPLLIVGSTYDFEVNYITTCPRHLKQRSPLIQRPHNPFGIISKHELGAFVACKTFNELDIIGKLDYLVAFLSIWVYVFVASSINFDTRKETFKIPSLMPINTKVLTLLINY